jgi:hypothetical protein
MNACLDPVPFETLVALWVGELGPADSERIEQHLFACDVCAASSDRLGKVVVGLRRTLPPVISHDHRDRLVAGGLRIRHTPVAAGIDAEAHFGSDVDLLVHVLKGDFAGADRVDVDVLDPQGIARLQMANVPFDRQTGEVLIACQRHFQHEGGFAGDPVFKVQAYVAGVPLQVGTYFVRHHWG